MKEIELHTTTETIDERLLDLDERSTASILSTLLNSQQRAVDAVNLASESLDRAVSLAAQRLACADGRLVMVGAGASGRLAVQDGAELWPTFSWPDERLLCVMAGGDSALTRSVEGVEDDAQLAASQVAANAIDERDVVIGVAASGGSPWTCRWLTESAARGALCIGMANNANTPLLQAADVPVLLATGQEVLAGSTRMAAGTAQKIALNLFSTTLMIRLNRTYGNLMVDMGAVNAKLDHRRIRLLQAVLPDVSDEQAHICLRQASGWVKLAVLIARGDTKERATQRLAAHRGALRSALSEISTGTS